MVYPNSIMNISTNIYGFISFSKFFSFRNGRSEGTRSTFQFVFFNHVALSLLYALLYM